MPTDVTLLLLRHGQSEWNAIHRWQGSFDSPLTELGRDQAVETAWVLAGLPRRFDAVWTSDLTRAAETASIIADALDLEPPELDARLREAHAGEWEGLTPDEIEVTWPGWLSEHRRPDRFESFDAVIERVEAALLDISRAALLRRAASGASTATVLVVAHSGVIRSLVRRLGATDERVPNLGGIWVDVSLTDDPRTVSSVTGSSVTGSSVTGDRQRLSLNSLFDPHGIVISGIDIPGEEPG